MFPVLDTNLCLELHIYEVSILGGGISGGFTELTLCAFQVAVPSCKVVRSLSKLSNS